MSLMFEAIARVLAFFYSLPVVGGSVGVAIILLTAAVMILLMPLTLKATRSTIKMQEMQPKLKELQKKHKDDKQTMNAELMALYQENGINPVGGCLPMIAQLPVFLVLFNVLRGLTRRVSEAPFYTVAEQARAQVGGQPVAGDTFEPRYLDVNSDLYIDITQQTELRFGPFDLALEARDVIQNDIVAGIPYVVLILFVVATSFYQQRQVSSRRTGTVGMNPQQEMILKVLPLASGVWSFLFPAGLVVYWATSNVFRILQQSYITRAYYGRKASEAVAGDSDSTGLSDSVAEDSSSELDDVAVDTTKKKPPAKKPKKKSSNGQGRGKKPADAASGSEDGLTDDRADDRADDREDEAAVSNGSSANGAGSAADKADAWAKRRQRANAKRSSTKDQTNSSSSRVTPKGTKPGSSKKKRKR